MITRVAITMIWRPILTLFGIWCRTILIVRLEKAVTRVTQIDITKAVDICPVTASAEQIPSTSRAIGLRLNTGPNISSLFVSAIESPFALDSVEKGFESVIAEPEVHQVLNAL